MITCTNAKHGVTINALAKEGEIQPIRFVMPDGTEYAANSLWAATDWLKANGHYEDRQEPVRFLGL